MSEIKPVHLTAVLKYWGVTTVDEPIALVKCRECQQFACTCTTTDEKEVAS